MIASPEISLPHEQAVVLGDDEEAKQDDLHNNDPPGCCLASCCCLLLIDEALGCLPRETTHTRQLCLSACPSVCLSSLSASSATAVVGTSQVTSSFVLVVFPQLLARTRIVVAPPLSSSLL